MELSSKDGSIFIFRIQLSVVRSSVYYQFSETVNLSIYNLHI